MKILEFLERSKVSEDFKNAVVDFLEGKETQLIRYNLFSPKIKIERTLTKLLEDFSNLPIEKVEINGNSGCEYFKGNLSFWIAEKETKIEFEWNCKWKAEQKHYKDFFGAPDQIRAAQEFGYDCFKFFDVREEKNLP
ncbi:hypothetical protein IT568_00065 [bacterium]|nr:hypothetical protein [bacterium]